MQAGNIHATLEDDEHIDVPITIGVERFICMKRFFMTVGLELLNHFFGKLWECEVWTKSVPVQSTT